MGTSESCNLWLRWQRSYGKNYYQLGTHLAGTLHVKFPLSVCLSMWAKVCKASLVLCCQDSEEVVSSDDNPALARFGS